MNPVGTERWGTSRAQSGAGPAQHQEKSRLLEGARAGELKVADSMQDRRM